MLAPVSKGRKEIGMRYEVGVWIVIVRKGQWGSMLRVRNAEPCAVCRYLT